MQRFSSPIKKLCDITFKFLNESKDLEKNVFLGRPIYMQTNWNEVPAEVCTCKKKMTYFLTGSIMTRHVRERYTRFSVVALSRIYYSARPSKKPMISSRTCDFCATARANSSSGAGSSGVMLVPPAAPPPPTVLPRGLTGPPVEYGQLPTGYSPPMDSRFPEEQKVHVTL